MPGALHHGWLLERNQTDRSVDRQADIQTDNTLIVIKISVSGSHGLGLPTTERRTSEIIRTINNHA